MNIIQSIVFSVVMALSPNLLQTQSTITDNNDEEFSAVQNSEKNEIKQLWQNSEYKKYLSFEVFENAMKGYQKNKEFKRGKIAIVDFSKPSSEKRLFVIDLNSNSLVFYTYVAHGKFSGENETTSYSNLPQSKMSSLGFYKTAETYLGKHGYSLRLDGLEKGINDKARERAIVMHGANYVSSSFIETHGRLGRSWGCPAVPEELSKPIIDYIKEGYALFIYDRDPMYQKHSLWK